MSQRTKLILTARRTKMPSTTGGFSLIEMVAYIGLVALIGTTVTSFVVQLISTNLQAQLTDEVLDNTRQATAIMAQEIRHATSIYTPTSAFAAHPGQLSLSTRRDTPTDDEETTYADFYLDDERLYLKREGQAAELITSERVRVSNLIFTHLDEASSTPAIRISLTMAYDTPDAQAAAQSSVTLFTTASLRSY